MDFFLGTIPAFSLIPAILVKVQDGKLSAKIETWGIPKLMGKTLLTGVVYCKVTYYMQPGQSQKD